MEPFENLDPVPEQIPVPEPVPEEVPMPEFFPEPPAQSQPEEAPIPRPEPAPQTYYHGAGAGRKESPYADSPYVRQHSAPEYQYQPQPPRKKAKAPKVKKPRNPSRGKTLLSVLLVIALVAAGCSVTAVCVNGLWEDRFESVQNQLHSLTAELQEALNAPAAPGSWGASQPVPDGTVMTPSQLYASCVNSVVAISTKVQTGDYYGSGGGSGSGFILSADGYVVTNYHVVDGASAIEVILHDDTAYTAELVGHDATNDIAVLKVEAENLPAAAIGSSAQLVIGDMVAAIGNPLGELASTQTVGYVSGINREVATDSTIISMIQTDAAINPGNSGGPLFNMYGQVIGVTTAKYSGTTGSGASIEGIGFAIPIDDVLPIIHDLIEYGYVTGAYMGVTVTNTDEASAAMYGLPTGARIESVVEGGAADRAGLRPKDIVIALGEYEVRNITDLTRALRNFKAGDTAAITILRSGKEMQIDILLDEKPQEMPAAEVPQPGPQMPNSDSYQDWYDYFFSPFFGG